MSIQETITGLIRAIRISEGVEVSLLNPAFPSPVEGQSVRLRFPRDFVTILSETRIPKLFGSNLVCQCKGMVRGIMDIASSGDIRQTLHSITFLELIHEYKSGMISYVLRFDGNPYFKNWNTQSIGSIIQSERPASVRVRGRLQYRLREGLRDTVLFPVDEESGAELPVAIRVDTSGIAPVTGHLTQQSFQSDNPAASVLSGSCVAEGTIIPASERTDGPFLIPSVLTIECGFGLHRLWQSGTTVRWFSEEEYAAPMI